MPNDDMTPTPGATPDRAFHDLAFKFVDTSGVPDRALTPEERATAIQGINDSKSAKQWVEFALKLALKLGTKFIG